MQWKHELYQTRFTAADLDVLDSLFLSVVPETVVDPQSDELERRL